MKILHISYSDILGGAARAAFRLHQAQRSAGLDSHMLVVDKRSDDPHVHSISKLSRLRILFASTICRLLLNLQKTKNTELHSLNLIPSGLPRYIDELKPDVINLHWVGGEMISVGEVARLKQPIIWTLHDMWAFCGCEHYDDERPSERYLHSYSVDSRHPQDHGLDLDRWNFKRKKKAWKNKQFHIVAPSHWLGECVRHSQLFGKQPLQVVPNCIDHEIYRPLSKSFARDILGLPQEKQLLLFGAMSSTSDPRKGYQLLIPALQQLKAEGRAEKLDLVVFGASQGNVTQMIGIPTHYMGHLHDDISLCLLYNAADIFIAPSLQDNLPNTLVESLACGTPCIAFNIGGMPDLIRERYNGLLVDNVDVSVLAESIAEFINSDFCDSPCDISLKSKIERSLEAVSLSYYRLYESVK